VRGKGVNFLLKTIINEAVKICPWIDGNKVYNGTKAIKKRQAKKVLDPTLKPLSITRSARMTLMCLLFSQNAMRRPRTALT
jgi:hypothetical protein